MQSRDNRQFAIERSWGFECTCTLCTQPPAYTDSSDDRIAAIAKLTSVLLGAKSNGKKVATDEDKPKIAEFLIDLYEQERLDSHIVDAWMWAAVVNKQVGRAWEAMKWIYRSQEGILIHEGPRNEGSERMANMVEEVGESLGLNNLDDGSGAFEMRIVGTTWGREP